MLVSPKIVLFGGVPKGWPRTPPAPFTVCRGTLREGLLLASRSNPGFLVVWDSSICFCWTTFRRLKSVMEQGAVAVAFPYPHEIPFLFDLRVFAVTPDQRYFPLDIPEGYDAHPSWFWRAIRHAPGFRTLPVPRVLA